MRLDDQLCFALYAATHAITRSYRPLLEQLQLTYPQYLVMLVLWQDGASSSGAIARRLRLAPGAVTPLVDHLQSAGLLNRTRGADDRRLTLIAPTEAGRRLEHAASLAQEEVACRTGLDPAELARLRDELIALADRMAQEA